MTLLVGAIVFHGVALRFLLDVAGKVGARRVAYRVVYLHSPHWLVVRQLRLALARRRCADCGGRATDCHHRTYALLGAEWVWPWCLAALCRRCHRRRHGSA